MRQRQFSLLIFVVVIGVVILFRYQRAALVREQATLAARRGGTTGEAPGTGENTATPSAPPSAELLRLRGEVGVTRRQAEEQERSASARAYSNDWQMIYSDPRPSQFPDFISFTNLAKGRFETPDNALQSWHYAFHNQGAEPLDSTRMKEIWDVPDDFDQEPGYNIHMGEGLYGGTGFRVVGREMLSSNVLRLVIDYEKEDGSSYRRERTLVQRNGRWRVQPVSVTRAKTEKTQGPEGNTEGSN